jgi:hypothetical protein
MLLYQMDERSELASTPNEKLMAAMGELIADMASSGVLLSTEGLQPSSKGKRLRMKQGELMVTDGPFTESKELVAGYAIVQVNSEEEAVELGRRFLQLHRDILGAEYEGVSEIRRMYEPSDFPPCAAVDAVAELGDPLTK